MRFLTLLFFSLASLSAQDFSQSVSPTIPWRVLWREPGGCTQNETYLNMATGKVRICSSANTWSDQGVQLDQSGNLTLPGNLAVSGTQTIGTTAPTGAPTNSLSVGGNLYGGSATLAANSRNSFCFMGDSLTVDGGGNYYNSGTYFLSSGWAYLLPMLSGGQIYSPYAQWNFGISGQTTAQILARESDVLTAPCNVVMILAGTDDLSSVSAATSIAHLSSMLSYYRANGRTVILSTVPPSTSYTAQAQLLNNEIRGLAISQNVPLVDFYSALAQTNGTYQTAYNSGDGVHPSAAGYVAMAQQAYSTLSPLLGTASLPIPVTTSDSSDLVAHSLMTGGSCNSGYPTGWGNSYGTGPAPTPTCTTATGVVGNWLTLTMSSTSANSGQYYVVTATGPISAATAGDTLLFVGKINLSGFEASGDSVNIKLTGNNIYSFGADTPSGTGWYTFAVAVTAPASAPTITFVLNYGATGGTAVFEVAQLGVYDLTALGWPY
jgi:acyl-CoA thioesterase I